MQLALAKEVIHQLDIVQDCRALQQDEIWLHNSLKKHTLALSSLLRTVARIRSRIGWLQDGDANTRLFHMHARHRKRKNFIAKLEYEGRTLTGHEEKAAAVLDFYSNLIGTDANRARTVNLDSLEVPTFDLEDLTTPFWRRRSGTRLNSCPLIKLPDPMVSLGGFIKPVGQSLKGILLLLSTPYGEEISETCGC